MKPYTFEHVRGPTEAGLRKNIAAWLRIADLAPTLELAVYAEAKALRIGKRIKQLRETGELKRRPNHLKGEKT